jgi:uracil-DNA glycosylase family protein
MTGLIVLRNEVRACQECDLYKYATQAVFGEGPPNAAIVFIGEQPGNDEDLSGRPFVGPAGRLFDRALEEAAIDRSAVYITNAVKHFKFEERGKRRLHKKPAAAEVRACHHWLTAEVEAIRPRVIVCLGATAAGSVFGSAHRVTRDRGIFVPHPASYPWAPKATSTIHTSAILRAPDEEARRVEYGRFVDDLKKVRAVA